MRAVSSVCWPIPASDETALMQVTTSGEATAMSKVVERPGSRSASPTTGQAFRQANGLANHHLSLATSATWSSKRSSFQPPPSQCPESGIRWKIHRSPCYSCATTDPGEGNEPTDEPSGLSCCGAGDSADHRVRPLLELLGQPTGAAFDARHSELAQPLGTGNRSDSRLGEPPVARLLVKVLRTGVRVPTRTARTPDLLAARIRKARLSLGLSLAAVAGKDFSRAFLNQVELGKARPSSRTLQIIADRLHRPIEYFLQNPEDSATVVELLLAEAGTRLRQGDAAQAKSTLLELAARPRLAPEVRARAQLLLAEAQLRLGAVEEALPVLRTAIR